jgi:hypothetical protein
MQPTMNDWQRLDELLERGLDFYGRQLVSEAIQCWREVLYLSPGHRLALEYLEAAGASAAEELEPDPEQGGKLATMMSAPAQEAAPSSPDEAPLTLESLSVLAVEMIRERRLEEALALLYTAHGEAPKDQAISRSIHVIKQRLTREYRAEIGGDLGQVPHLMGDDALIDELELSEDEREILRLVDGIVALDDVIQTAGFGALQTYRALAQLLRRNLIVLKAPMPLERSRTKTAPFRPTLVPPPPEQGAAPVATGPKLVSVPPVPEAPRPAVVTVPSIPAMPAIPAPPVTNASAPPPISSSIFSSVAPTTQLSRTPTDPPLPTSTALPMSATTATKMPIPPAPVPLANTTPSSNVSTSVTSVISANASAAVAASAASTAAAALSASASGKGLGTAMSNGQPNAPIDLTPSGAIAAALGTIDAQPRRPSAYASHVAEAVRAHLQGKLARARELLVLCIEECPSDDPAAQRNLQRLKERLGVKEER